MLETGGLGIGIKETLETDVLVKIMPMDADGADFILGTLLIRCFPKFVIPQQRLAIGFAIVPQTVDPVSVEPYLLIVFIGSLGPN